LHRQPQPQAHIVPTTIAGVTSRRGNDISPHHSLQAWFCCSISSFYDLFAITGSQIIISPVDEDAAASFNELLIFFFMLMYISVLENESLSILQALLPLYGNKI
jgi:hypothetical protein